MTLSDNNEPNSSKNTTRTDKQIGDNLFRHIFSQYDNAILLAAALLKTNFGDISNFSFIEFKDIPHSRLRHDLAFIINDIFAFLIEHQTTLGGSLPLRLSLYSSGILLHLYEKLDPNLHNLIDVKFPQLFSYILYYGDRLKTDFITYSYAEIYNQYFPDSGCGPDFKIKVLNMAEGYNDELKNRCVPLYEYSFFLKTLREFIENSDDLNDAISKTIKVCKNSNILVKYLHDFKEEVHDIMKESYFSEEEQKGFIAVGREEGREENKLDTARRMIAEHFSLKDISIATTMSIDELTKLQDKIGS